jgi:hypothetical protein
LADIGLATLLRVPIDLRQLKIKFMVGDNVSDDFMVIDLDGFSYEICPKYPNIGEMSPFWENISGDYDVLPRLPSGLPGTEILGQTTIWVEDGVLRMAGFVGPILPISDTEIIILSGPYAGETMFFEPTTGNIYHQNIVFRETNSLD